MDPSGLKPRPFPLIFDDKSTCASVLQLVLANDPRAKKCWSDFLAVTNAIQRPDMRKGCQGVLLACEKCTNSSAIAITQAGTIRFCCDSDQIKKVQTLELAQTFCHELTHVLQAQPCTRNGPNTDLKNVGCFDAVKYEFEAYWCSGQCSAGNDVLDQMKQCGQFALNSVFLSKFCSGYTKEQLLAIRDDFMLWILRNENSLRAKTFCRFTFDPNAKRVR